MSKIHLSRVTLASAVAAFFFAVTSSIATAGPFSGIGAAAAATASAGVTQNVHYRKYRRYHRHTHHKRRGYRRNRYYNRHHGRRVVRAPFTHVETGRHGVRVRAPFVDLWVPRRHHRRRYYGARYW